MRHQYLLLCHTPHRLSDRQTDRQTDRQRQTVRQCNTQTNRQMDRQTFHFHILNSHHIKVTILLLQFLQQQEIQHTIL